MNVQPASIKVVEVKISSFPKELICPRCKCRILTAVPNFMGSQGTPILRCEGCIHEEPKYYTIEVSQIAKPITNMN